MQHCQRHNGPRVLILELESDVFVHHLHLLQIWPPGRVTCIAILPWIVLLAVSAGIEWVSSSDRVTSVKSQKPLRVSETLSIVQAQPQQGSVPSDPDNLRPQPCLIIEISVKTATCGIPALLFFVSALVLSANHGGKKASGFKAVEKFDM